MAAYADVSEYREDTGDEDTAESRVTAVLAQQSAKLRAELGDGADARIAKSEDAQALARLLVVDAARKQLVRPSFDGVGEVDGATTASFTANGFQSSYTLQNPSGTAYFDRSTLVALKRLLGCGQAVGTVLPFYGGR